MLYPPGGKLLCHTIVWRLVRKQTFGSVLPLLRASSVRVHFLCAYGFSESVYVFCEKPLYTLHHCSHVNGKRWKVIATFPFRLNSYNSPLTYRRSNTARETAQWNQYAVRTCNVSGVVIKYVICGVFTPDNIKNFIPYTKLIYLEFPAAF